MYIFLSTGFSTARSTFIAHGWCDVAGNGGVSAAGTDQLLVHLFLSKRAFKLYRAVQ